MHAHLSRLVFSQDHGARERALSTMASMSSAQIVSATAMQNKMAATVAHAAAVATHAAGNVTHEHTVVKQQPPSPSSSSPATVSLTSIKTYLHSCTAGVFIVHCEYPA